MICEMCSQHYNTLRAFVYNADGCAEVSAHLSPHQKKMARKTLELCGLNRCSPAGFPEPTEGDERYTRRKRSWAIASDLKKWLAEYESNELSELITDILRKSVFYVCWTVFSDAPDMRRRLREDRQGTACDCFDSQEELLPRSSGFL